MSGIDELFDYANRIARRAGLSRARPATALYSWLRAWGTLRDVGRAIPPAPGAPPVVVEPPRLLAAKSEYGYVDRVDLALVDEPEAVAVADQREITARAQRQASTRALALWRDSSARWLGDLDALVATRFDVDVSDELRALTRAIERVDRKLGVRSLAFSA